jgi:hypothetical protein
MFLILRNDQSLTNVEVGYSVITEPQSIAEVFANHFSSTFNSSLPKNTQINPDITCSDFLNTPCITDSDAKRAIIHFLSTKSVRPDNISNFVIKSCSDIFNPLFPYIFNFS